MDEEEDDDRITIEELDEMQERIKNYPTKMKNIQSIVEEIKGLKIFNNFKLRATTEFNPCHTIRHPIYVRSPNGGVVFALIGR